MSMEVTIGIVTMEDCFEELVGNMDETINIEEEIISH